MIDRPIALAAAGFVIAGEHGDAFQESRFTRPVLADDDGDGTIEILRDDRVVATLHPQKRQYSGGEQIQTKSAIDPGLFRDVYVALGEPLENGAWAVRIYVKPFVRWIWLGGLFMMFGGFVAATDRRFRELPEPCP